MVIPNKCYGLLALIRSISSVLYGRCPPFAGTGLQNSPVCWRATDHRYTGAIKGRNDGVNLEQVDVFYLSTISGVGTIGLH